MELALLTLLLGGAISLGSSLLTAAIQNRSAEKRRQKERSEAEIDAKRERGALHARDCLDLTTEMLGYVGQNFREFDIRFDPALIARATVAGLLVTDPTVRMLTTRTFSSLHGFRVAIERGVVSDHGKRPRNYQLWALQSLNSVLAAHVRGDRIPDNHVDNLMLLFHRMDKAWADEAEQQARSGANDHADTASS